jgi:hypothetical protein
MIVYMSLINEVIRLRKDKDVRFLLNRCFSHLTVLKCEARNAAHNPAFRSRLAYHARIGILDSRPRLL